MERLEKVFIDSLEERNEMVPEKLIKARGELMDALENYVCELQEYEWICGYKYALSTLTKSRRINMNEEKI